MNERIRQIIEYYGLSIRAFEQKIFVSESLIYRGLARNSDFSASVIAKILNFCPDISPDWLLLGKGEMLRQNVPVSTEKYTCDEQHVPQNANQGTFPADNAMCEKIIADLRSELAAAYRTIGQLEYRLQQEGEKTNSTSEKTGMAITLA